MIVENFWTRLCKVYETEEIAEISRKLGKPYQTIKNYSTGRLPDAEVLLHISDETGISIQWLLIYGACQ